MGYQLLGKICLQDVKHVVILADVKHVIMFPIIML